MGAGNFLKELLSSANLLLRTDRLYFCRGRAFVTISRKLVQMEPGLRENEKRATNLLSVMVSIRHALDLSRVEKPDKKTDEAFRTATHSIETHVHKYLPSRWEDIKHILREGESGDAKIEGQISESNNMVNQMLRMFQPKSLSLTLVLYPLVLIDEDEKPVRSLAIPCEINQEMSLDSLLCRMPLTIDEDWIFSLGLNPFCYRRNPTIQKTVNSTRNILALDASKTIKELKDSKDSTPIGKLHIVMDRGFFIHAGWLPKPLQIFGNAWPLLIAKDRDKRPITEFKRSTLAAMKTLTGDIIVAEHPIDIWEELRDRNGTNNVDIPQPGCGRKLTSWPIHSPEITSTSSQSTLIAPETAQEATTLPFIFPQPSLYLDHGSTSVPASTAQPSLFSAPDSFPSIPAVEASPEEQIPNSNPPPPFPSPSFPEEVTSERPPSLPIASPSGPSFFVVRNHGSATPVPSTVELLLPSALYSPPSSNNMASLNHNKQESSLARGYGGSHGDSTNSEATLVTGMPLANKSSVTIPKKNDTAAETLPTGKMRTLQIQKPMSWFERGKKFVKDVKDVVTGVKK